MIWPLVETGGDTVIDCKGIELPLEDVSRRTRLSGIYLWLLTYKILEKTDISNKDGHNDTNLLYLLMSKTF